MALITLLSQIQPTKLTPHHLHHLQTLKSQSTDAQDTIKPSLNASYAIKDIQSSTKPAITKSKAAFAIKLSERTLYVKHVTHLINYNVPHKSAF